MADAITRIALISDLSLTSFWRCRLMSMQLWTLGGLGPALVVGAGVQTIAAVAYIVLVVFPRWVETTRRP